MVIMLITVFGNTASILPVVAKRTSRYRGPVGPEDLTAVSLAARTGVNPVKKMSCA